ncbi:conserved hypothetical protein [Hahella chejuensis KCTC 2396]|uniref:Lipoprotein n=2 Tax=Hahella chejuensis TaxID=158327 RepID=Q2SKE0_HAHCH|nr:conserved hypothetical protein [Hahella chejuensis KCTC 2396]
MLRFIMILLIFIMAGCSTDNGDGSRFEALMTASKQEREKASQDLQKISKSFSDGKASRENISEQVLTQLEVKVRNGEDASAERQQIQELAEQIKRDSDAVLSAVDNLFNESVKALALASAAYDLCGIEGERANLVAIVRKMDNHPDRKYNAEDAYWKFKWEFQNELKEGNVETECEYFLSQKEELEASFELAFQAMNYSKNLHPQEAGSVSP